MENAMNEPKNAAPDENSLIAERRGKLAALRGQGVAFPNDFRRRDEAGALQTGYADAERWTGEALEAEGVRVAVAGRLMAKRLMGKAAFAHPVAVRLGVDDAVLTFGVGNDAVAGKVDHQHAARLQAAASGDARRGQIEHAGFRSEHEKAVGGDGVTAGP